jgi:amino acid transporter
MDNDKTLKTALPPDAYAAESPYKQELKRTLTLKDLVIFGLLSVFPMAPIQVYGSVTSQTMGMAPLVYIVGVVAMIFTAISYDSLAREFPLTGASYMYVSKTINPHIGFLAGWLITIDYILVPSLLVSFGGVWMSSLTPALPPYFWIIVFTAIITFINGRGIRITANTDMVMLILELICIALFIVTAFKFVLIDGGGTGGFSLDSVYRAGSVNMTFIAQATTIAIFGYLGFDGITALSEEVENPKKNVGRAIIATLCLIGACFILQSYFASLAHPAYDDLDPDLAFFQIVREVGGDVLYYVFLFVGIIACGIANALVVQTSIARILFSMSRDKVLPGSKFLGKIHPKFQTPLNATILVGLVTVVVAMLSIEVLLQVVAFGALTTFLVVNVAVVVYFCFKQKKRGASLFRYLVLPVIGFAIIMFVWVQFDKVAFIMGGIWIAIGVVIGAVKSKGYKIVPEAFTKDMMQ